MRWTRWVGIAVSLGSLALLGGALSCAQNAGQTASNEPHAMTQEEKVARGRYLVTIGGCNDCHTPGGLYGAMDSTRMLSGSELGWQGPWGVSYPRNLTPDSTGLGNWTDEQIMEAFQRGHRPDGGPILPPMPWFNYGQMPPEDAQAVVAYLRSLPPVHHVSPDRVPPGGKPTTPVLTFPGPPAWDAQNLPPPPTSGS